MARKSALRQQMFAQEYVIDLNGRRAAIAAGYSETGAEVEASRLLTKPNVRKLIDDLNTRRASKLNLSAEKIDEEVARLAFARIKQFMTVDAEGKPVMDFSTATDDEWACVQEIREDTTGGSGDGERKVVVRTTLKLSDKTKNLELLYRRLGLLQDNMKVSGLEGLAEGIAKFRKEPDKP